MIETLWQLLIAGLERALSALRDLKAHLPASYLDSGISRLHRLKL